MEKRRLVVGFAVSAAVVAIWLALTSWINKTYPPAPPAPAPLAAATEPATTQDSTPRPATTSVGGTQEPVKPPTSARTPAGELTAQGGEHATVDLGDSALDPAGKSTYTLGLKLSTLGACVESATLNRYRSQAGGNDPFVFQNVGSSPLATDTLTIGDKSVSLWDVDWRVEEKTQDSVVFGATVNEGGKRLLEIRKTYRMQPASADKDSPGRSYEVLVSYSIDKVARDLKMELSFNGTSTPLPASIRDTPEVVVGYNDNKNVSLLHWPASGINEWAKNLADPKGKSILWAGCVNAYVAAIVLPQTAGDKPQPLTLSSAKARILNMDAPTEERKAIVKLAADGLSAGPNSPASFDLHVFLGPKLRNVLQSDYYSSSPRSYEKTLLLTGSCSFCTFDWLVEGLVKLLRGLQYVLRDWGLSIIALVLIVRLLLHPITKRSQISMSKMSKMAPEMERLKKKYGDNKEELNKAMMELYKETGFAPFLGCLPMFLQMPIWIALWTALQNTFELWQAPFLWGFTWIKDLSQPDRLISFGHAYKIFFFHIDGLNILPLLMAVVFWLQQKFQPKPLTTTPEQAQQQKMMQWMTLIFPLLLYNGPAGLNLYILTSTAIGIWESKRVRDHLKEREEAERGGRVIVETKATRSSKRLKDDQTTPETPKGCLMGWMAEMQRKAEEMRGENDKKKPKR